MKLAQIKQLLLENDEGDDTQQDDPRPSEAEAKESFYEMWDDIVTEKVTPFVEKTLPTLIYQQWISFSGTKIAIGNSQALIDLCRRLARGGMSEDEAFASFDGIDIEVDTEHKAAFQADIHKHFFHFCSNAVWEFLDNNCSVKECLIKLGNYGHNNYYQFSAGYDSIDHMRRELKYNIVRSIKFNNLYMESDASIPLHAFGSDGGPSTLDGYIGIVMAPTFKGEKILVECSGEQVVVCFAPDTQADVDNIKFSFSPKISIEVMQALPNGVSTKLLDLGFPQTINVIRFNSGAEGTREWTSGISTKRILNWGYRVLNYPEFGAPTNPMDILSKFNHSKEFDNLLRYISSNQSKVMININLSSKADGEIFLSAFRDFYHFLLLVEHGSIKVYSDNGFANAITELAQQLEEAGISEFDMEDWMGEYQHLWEDYITLG